MSKSKVKPVYRTYVYKLVHRLSGSRVYIDVWAGSEVIAEKAVSDMYGDGYTFALHEVKDKRFYTGITCD